MASPRLAAPLLVVLALIGTVFALMIVLKQLGQRKFQLMERFVAGPMKTETNWMPTASGQHPEGEPMGVLESEEAGLDLKSPVIEKLLTSDRLVPMPAEEAEGHWSQTTSERCFRSDQAEPLRKVRNFLQRTNNYSRSHPDSCSAPNHEFVGTFYRPHEGVGAKPASGLPYPAGSMGSTQ